MADKTVRYYDTLSQGAVDVLHRDTGLGYAPSQAAAPSAAISTAAPLTGQVTVTTAGTAVQGPSVALINGALIFTQPTNTSSGFVGNDGTGDVTSTSGVAMTPATISVVLTNVDNLDKLWFDVLVNGEGFSWMRL